MCELPGCKNYLERTETLGCRLLVLTYIMFVFIPFCARKVPHILYHFTVSHPKLCIVLVYVYNWLM